MIQKDRRIIDEQLRALIGKSSLIAIDEVDVKRVFPDGGPDVMLHV